MLLSVPRPPLNLKERRRKLFTNDGAGEPLIVTGEPMQPPLGGESSSGGHSAWWQLLLLSALPFAGRTLVRRWGRRGMAVEPEP